jgi:hypothetical protein
VTEADDEIDINPRSATEAGNRLIILASLMRRVFLEEQLARETLNEEVADERFDLNAFVSNEISLEEIEELASVSVAITLGWYVQLIQELPSYLSQFGVALLIDQVPAPWDLVAPWLESLKPRSLEELAVQRELAELWVWRSEIESDRRNCTGQDLSEIERAIQETLTEAAAAGLIALRERKDFELNGVPFRQFGGDEQEAISLEAINRLRTLNWLCGFGDSWSDVPLDV